MNSVIQILICCSVSEFQCPIKFHWHLEWNIYHKKKVAFRNGIQRNQRYIPISCARNISAMSSNIWLFCLEILLGLTVKRDGWSVYQWLLYSPENQTPHSRQCSQLIFASALMKSSNFWITFCTKWS